MDGLIRKQFAITVKEQTASGGRIVISTATEDRDRDVVRPEGARIEAYLQNPVTQWAHNYRDPWATIGRTINLTVSPDGIEAEFELRPAANEADPQNVVLLLWGGGWVRTASIGFRPLRWEERDGGGFDYVEWELLEWSLVPVPANAEALRVMSKALGDLAVSKYGRVLSAANEGRIARARDLLSEVLEQLSEQEDGTTERMTPLSTLKAGDVGAIDWGATSTMTINSGDLDWVGPEGWAVVSKEADNVTSETISTGEALELGISGSGGADATAATDADVGITPEQATELSRTLGEFVNQITDRIRGR